MEVNLPSEEFVVKVHANIVKHFGGRQGVISPQYVNSAIYRPKQYIAYSSPCTIHTACAAILDGLARNHAFVEGNKRTALIATVMTYYLNGIDFDYGAKINEEFVSLVLWVVEQKPSIEEVAKKLKTIVEKYGTSKHIKLGRTILKSSDNI